MFLALLILLLIVIGLILGLRSSYLRITNIDLQGVDSSRKDEINAAIASTLQGNRLLFLPRNEILFYSTKKLTGELMNEYSYIQNVTVRKRYPRGLEIKVTERTPVALYCDPNCYFLDSTGLIYAPASSFSTGVYMTYSDETRSTSTSPLETAFTDQATFSLIQNYLSEIGTLGLTPVRVTFIAPREVRIDISQNGYILVDLDSPFNETVENIHTVLLQGITSFEYIDVRYGNKIFYK